MKRPTTLSAAFVKTIREPGRYGDGRGGYGLTLLVKAMTSTGRTSRTWSQRLRVNGQIVAVGLGSFPVVSLSQARDKALENKRTLAEGVDPRNSAAAPTFAETADKVIALHAESWRDNGKSEKQWRASLRTYVYPMLGDSPVAFITSADVLEVLTPIWNVKRETARRVRQRIGQVMKYAIASGLRPDNPAGDAIGAVLPANGAVKKHQPALPHAEVAAALGKIRESGGAGRSAKQALLFAVLTASRSGEARGARWDEIHTGSRTWTIPGSRMKTGIEHRVPLSDAAMGLLVTATPLKDGSGLIFPSASRRGKQLSDRTLSKVIRELGLPCVVHGFRSSFRDWCADTGQRRELAEAALSHVVGGVEGAYMRSDLFEGRRELMAAWAAYVGG